MRNLPHAVLLLALSASGQQLTAVAQETKLAVVALPPDVVVRLTCATSCGKLFQEGWRGYIDSSKCNLCVCRSGAFQCQATSRKCAEEQAGVPECLEEDEECSGLPDFCPTGTTCTDSDGNGIFTCEQSRSSACASTACAKDSVCKISSFGTAVCRRGCTRACGDSVPHGWSGHDNGANHCNSCSCSDLGLICTRMLCLPRLCPKECTPYTPATPCLLTVDSPLELKLELARPAVPELTFRRMCYNAATCSCGFYPMVRCLVNPCSNVSCRAGYHCKANYCGGCNYQCVKDKCPPRVRHAYSTMSCADRKLFVRAVKQYKLSNPSEYSDFVSMHQQAWSYAHSSSEFFPWHRMYLVGFENALRSQGGEFECITVPYWDWEKDAGSEATSPPFRCDTFGRVSGTDASDCVTEGIADYPTWTVSAGTCLRRTFSSGVGFTGEATLLSHVSSLSSYSSFRPNIEASPHAAPHVYVGGHLATAISPEDPLFWIHHCNVDRLWALWQDYHGYDEVSKAAYTSTHYSPSANLNNVMPFDIDMSGTVLSYFSSPVTVRDMMHIHDMPGGNSYEYGADALAFTLGSPVAGSWSWLTPGTAPTVSCFTFCAAVIAPFLPDRIFFHNPVIPFERVFKEQTCGNPQLEQDVKAKDQIFKKLQQMECDALADKPTASDEWLKTMWREDTSFFKRCP